MKYLKLQVNLLDLDPRKKVIRLDEQDAERLLRDVIAQAIYNLVSSEPTKNLQMKAMIPFSPKEFKTMDEHKMLFKLKERLLYSDSEWLELGNDLFKFIKNNIKAEGYTSAVSHLLCRIDEFLDEAEKQDEEKTEKIFNKEKNNKGMTQKEYYKSLGYKVEIVKNQNENTSPNKGKNTK